MYIHKNYRLWVSILVAVVVCGYVVYSFYVSYRAVQVSYEAFLLAEERHVTSAVIPSIDQNPIRQELNQVLAEALSDGMSSTARLERAKRGVALLKDTEKQIDMTMKTRDVLIAAIRDVREQDGILAGSLHAYDIARVTALAEQQMAIVDDIRGLSYRANFHTGQIFDQLIRDDGTLTPAHVVALNDLIPKVEEQFDQRSNLYAELESLHSQVVE
jgi:hypothetical protein